MNHCTLHIRRTGKWHVVGTWDVTPIPKKHWWHTQLWRIERDCALVSPAGLVILLRKGDVVDGASFPRILWFLFQPMGGNWGRAASFHDKGYQVQVVDVVDEEGRFIEINMPVCQAIVDQFFLECMALEPYVVEKCLREKFYRALRMCGWVAWNNHRRKLQKSVA